MIQTFIVHALDFQVGMDRRGLSRIQFVTSQIRLVLPPSVRVESGRSLDIAIKLWLVLPSDSSKTPNAKTQNDEQDKADSRAAMVHATNY
jgi:hypothetical protein